MRIACSSMRISPREVGLQCAVDKFSRMESFQEVKFTEICLKEQKTQRVLL
jgi:hypothetical protein